MTTCFCGCGREVPFGRKRAANAVGMQLDTDLRMVRGAQERAPEVVADPSVPMLLDSGDRLRGQLVARLHDEITRDDVDKQAMKDVMDQMKPLRVAMTEWASPLEGGGMLGLHNAEVALLGRQATATLTRVQDTGTTINESPRVKLTFDVAPEGGEPFALEIKRTVSRVNIPRPGLTMPITYDAADPQEHYVYDPAALDGALAAGAEAPAGGPAAADPVEQIAKLAQMHEAGALSDAEFAEAKARLIQGM